MADIKKVTGGVCRRRDTPLNKDNCETNIQRDPLFQTCFTGTPSNAAATSCVKATAKVSAYDLYATRYPEVILRKVSRSEAPTEDELKIVLEGKGIKDPTKTFIEEVVAGAEQKFGDGMAYEPWALETIEQHMKGVLGRPSPMYNKIKTAILEAKKPLRYVDADPAAQKLFTDDNGKLPLSLLKTEELQEGVRMADQVRTHLDWVTTTETKAKESDAKVEVRGSGAVLKSTFIGLDAAKDGETDPVRQDEYSRIKSLTAGVFQGNHQISFRVDLASEQTQRIASADIDKMKSGDPDADAGFDSNYKPVPLTSYLGDVIGSGLRFSLAYDGRSDSMRWGDFSLYGGLQLGFASFEVRRDEYQRKGSNVTEITVQPRITGYYDLLQGAYGVLRAGLQVQAGVMFRNGENYRGQPLAVSDAYIMDGSTYDDTTFLTGARLMLEYQLAKNFSVIINGGYEGTFEKSKQIQMTEGTGTDSPSEQGHIEDSGIRGRPVGGVEFKFHF